MRFVQVNPRNESAVIAQAEVCLKQGGTVIFPTETVYGIGAAAENDGAIAAVYAAKGRARDKPLALHVNDVSQAEPFVSDWTVAARRVIEKFWPGPIAVIVTRAAGRFESAANGLPTISLRCPDQAFTRSLLARCGPLAATSANRSGAAAFTGASDDRTQLPEATLAFLAGPTAFQRESTIVDCTTETPRVLRWGAVAADALAATLGTESLTR